MSSGNKVVRILLFPARGMFRILQDRMDFLRDHRLKLMIAGVMRLWRLLNGTTRLVEFADTVYPSLHPGSGLKIGIIDHSYHQKTGSQSFFIDILREAGEVTVIWDSRWNGGKAPSIGRINRQGFDLIIIWQVMIYNQPGRLKRLACRNIVIIPMYDDIHADPDWLFRRFCNYRFISFSRALHERLTRIGLRSRHFRYFADVRGSTGTASSFNELKGFFWQRTNDITWELVRKLIGDTDFAKIHLHLALDPIWYREVLPDESETERFNITVSHWFDQKDEFLEIFSDHNVVFIPRLYEGIGMSVIEAMTAGKLVVAPDHPTMNEYITHGVNGLLYDPDNPAPLDFSDASGIAARALDTCKQGHREWTRSVPELLGFILEGTGNRVIM